MGRVSWRRFPLIFARACRPCPIVATRSQNRVEGAQEEAQCRYGAGRPHGGATGGAAWVVCRPSALKYRGRFQDGSRFRLIWTCVWLVGQDFFSFSFLGNELLGPTKKKMKCGNNVFFLSSRTEALAEPVANCGNCWEKKKKRKRDVANAKCSAHLGHPWSPISPYNERSEHSGLPCSRSYFS